MTSPTKKPYLEMLAERIRNRFAGLSTIKEKEMFGGLVFMARGKMCVCVVKDDLMCRIDPELYEMALTKKGCRPMDFTGKPMKGWVFIDQTGIQSEKQFEYWIDLALEYNKKSKPAKKRKPAKKKPVQKS